MAKTGFWLRGAKGKLAGAALQKGAKKGQQTMAAFLQYNLRLLRDKVEKAIADGTEVIPKVETQAVAQASKRETKRQAF